MASCEQCWRDSHGDPELYRYFIKTRQCTPEEQAGLEARICPVCGRKALHEILHWCMVPGCIGGRRTEEPATPAEKEA